MLFSNLPRDILQYEIRSQLDDIRVLRLRVPLHLDKFGARISFDLQRQVLSHSLWFIEYFIDQDLIKRSRLLRLCAEVGNLPRLQYFHKLKEFHWDGGIANAAIMYNHVDCLNYALNNSNSFSQRYAKYLCAQYGSLDCMKYLEERYGVTWNVDSHRTAIAYGHAHCVTYLYDKVNGVEWKRTIELIVVKAINNPGCGNDQLLVVHKGGLSLDWPVVHARLVRLPGTLTYLATLGYK